MTKVIVGIPAYNEENSIAEVVGRCLEHASSVVVVDDGSTDATSFRAYGAGAVVIRHYGNHGKGAAIVTLFDYALADGADILVLIDGDGQHDPAEMPTLLAPVLSWRKHRGQTTDVLSLDYALGHTRAAVDHLESVSPAIRANLHLTDDDVWAARRAYLANAYWGATRASFQARDWRGARSRALATAWWGSGLRRIEGLTGIAAAAAHLDLERAVERLAGLLPAVRRASQ